MLDFLLGSFFVFLLIRGWARGFVREAMDLLGVVVGLALAFRMSPVAGSVVSGITGSSPTISRFIGGLALFVLVGGIAAMLAHYLQRVARLPGMALGNRVTGAGLALAWGAFLATVALTTVSLVRLPAAVASQIQDSSVASTLIDPGGVPQAVFSQVAGDRVVEVLVNLDALLDGERVVIEGNDTVTFDAADIGDVALDARASKQLLDDLNEERRTRNLKPLSWSPALADVAADHAGEMYTEGYFSHYSPTTGWVTDRVAGLADVRGGTAENLALAADAVEAHRGLVGSPDHLENILTPAFTDVGIAALDGPYGLIVVQVFGA